MCKILNKGRLFVISAPSGAGKTTLVNLLVEEIPYFVRNVSFTTRLPREHEQNGKDYHFVSHAEFQKMIKDDEFLESTLMYMDNTMELLKKACLMKFKMESMYA